MGGRPRQHPPPPRRLPPLRRRPYPHVLRQHALEPCLARGQGRPPQLPLLPPLLPFLIFPNTEAPSFFCAIDRRRYALPLLRAVRNARLCGSGDGGWLVLALDTRHTYALYNIYTRERINLPRGLRFSDDRNLPLVLRVATLPFSPTSRHGYMIGVIVLVGNKCCPAFCGWLHMVVRYIYTDGGTGVLRVFRFQIMELRAYGRPYQATWVDVQELDGRMLFVGRGSSRSIDVAQFDRFKDSTMYFLDDCFIPHPERTADNRRRYSFFDMGRYSMYDETSLDESWPPTARRPEWSDNAPCAWWFH
ncbi:unnamed protein product [Alopecurus aequalis]